MTTTDDILRDYRRWLLKMANVLLPYGTEADKQDLAQEGHIAMWKAMQTFDASKGALPTWLTNAAQMRMRDIIRRGNFTGKPENRGNKTIRTTPVDTQEDELMTALVGAESLERVMIAYHAGEIADALSRLTKAQRDYVIRRFWRDQPTATLELVAGKRSRDMWKEIKPQLAERLGHLAGIV